MNSNNLQKSERQPWKLIPLVVLLLLLFAFKSSAQDTIICSKIPIIPPDFRVTESHWEDAQSFWQNGGHVPANVIDEDITNFARAHIKKTGYATLRVSTDFVFEAGMYAGFYIKSPAFTDGTVDAVTITTYLNGTLQESYSGSDLLFDVATQNNDTIHVGFITTLPFNQVEVTFDTSQGMTHFDVFYAVYGICQGELLPVSWLSFEARKKGEASALTWSTAQEINNAGYYVERSSDGRLYESIGYVEATKQVRSVNVYSFIDPTPFGGLNYYRIRQVDNDGRMSYSPVRTLSYSAESVFVKLWPNPTAENLFIEIPGNEGTAGNIKIVSAAGVVVWNQSFDKFATQTEVDTRSVESGIYNVIIESAGNIYTERIIVLK